MNNSHEKDVRIINNDYVILFDENGQPYIAHASMREIADKAITTIRRGASKLKGMKRPGAKYYQRIDDPKHPGKYLYFYSKQEYDTYMKNRMNLHRTAQQQAQMQRIESNARKAYNNSLRGKINNTFDRMRNDFRNKTGVGLQQKVKKEQKEAREVNDRYNRTLQSYREAFNKGDKENEARLGNELRSYDRIRSKEESDVRNAQNTYNNSLIGRTKNAVTTRVDDVKNKLNDMQDAKSKQKELSAKEKREQATENYYQQRRSSGFQDNKSILGNINKGRSDYSNDAIDQKIATALKPDGVNLMESDDPKIKSSQNKIVKARKDFEQHTLDLEQAQRYAQESGERLKRAQEAYDLIVDDDTSSRDAIKQARKRLQEAESDNKQTAKDITQLTKLLDDDQKAYHSAIQIYNMELHINKLK